MPYFDFCRNCDKTIDTPMRIDSQFCSESCRHDFHNTHKKVVRAHARAIEAIAYLQEVLSGAGEEPRAVFDLLTDIENAARSASVDVSWKCKECGQRTFLRPTPATACDFCGHSTFVPIMPAHRKLR